MPDTRKSSDRPRQTAIRLGAETDRQIAELKWVLFDEDPLSRPVSAADVIRYAVAALHRSKCTSAQNKSKKSSERA